ncbi:MAG: helix-turn-helix domain-containing protein [Bacteroidota bacterium]
MPDLLRALTLEEACDRLCISPRTLYGMRKEGQIRTVMIGNSPRIPLSEIQRLLAVGSPEQHAHPMAA